MTKYGHVTTYGHLGGRLSKALQRNSPAVPLQEIADSASVALGALHHRDYFGLLVAAIDCGLPLLLAAGLAFLVAFPSLASRPRVPAWRCSRNRFC